MKKASDDRPDISAKIKEYYELCWEYLKRSEVYERHCRRVREHREFVEREAGIKLDPRTHSHSGDFKKVTEDDHVLSRQHPDLQSIYTYGFFGDVHETKFEDWWENKKKVWAERNKSWIMDAVREYHQEKKTERPKERQPIIAYGKIQDDKSVIQGGIYYYSGFFNHRQSKPTAFSYVSDRQHSFSLCGI